MNTEGQLWAKIILFCKNSCKLIDKKIQKANTAFQMSKI